MQFGMSGENEPHSDYVVAWGHLRFSEPLLSSPVTPFFHRRPSHPPSNPYAHTHTHTRTYMHTTFLHLSVSALFTNAPRNSPCCLWQPQVAFRFMPCQIARIPVSHSLWHYLRKGQLLLCWASLNFLALVGARWLGCCGTWKRKTFMTTWQLWSDENLVVYNLATFLSTSWVQPFLLDHILPFSQWASGSVLHLCCFHEIPDVSFCLTSFVSSSISWPLSDSCKPQPACVCLKVICALRSSGCQLDKALHIIKNNNCLQGLRGCVD